MLLEKMDYKYFEKFSCDSKINAKYSKREERKEAGRQYESARYREKKSFSRK